jgi:hypothetical protein
MAHRVLVEFDSEPGAIRHGSIAILDERLGEKAVLMYEISTHALAMVQLAAAAEA